MPAEMHQLIGAKGSGSTIVEALFTLAEIPYDVVYLDLEEVYGNSPKILEVNPVGQVPALRLPGGTIMTESAAIALYLGDIAPAAGLVPAADAPGRAMFLRFLVMIVAAIYPTFTYGDDPERWVSNPEGARELKARTDQRRMELWRMIEAAVTPAPWVLGPQLTALDVYVGVMSRWRPGRQNFGRFCPKLLAVAERLDAEPRLQEVWQRNFS